MTAVSSFHNQNYQELKKLHHANNLFRDDTFPADARALGANVVVQCIWKRPWEIHRDPQFVVKSATRFDVNQGAIGNCWFTAALAAIAQHKQLFKCVVPSDQSYGTDYTGMFHFRFWRDNQWCDVVIDDKLPCTPDGKLIFVRGGARSEEFWAPLLEKAYAKFHGSYAKLDGGVTEQALQELTAGTAKSYDLKNKTAEGTWALMDEAYKKGGLMTASIFAEGTKITAPYIFSGLKLPNGLLRQHAYTITAVTNIRTINGHERLVRLRNPWGNEVEWNGDWSDKSSKWNEVSTETLEKFQIKDAADGEFWMNFRDFAANFHYLTNCFPPGRRLLPGGERRRGHHRRPRKPEDPGKKQYPDYPVQPPQYPIYPEWNPSQQPEVPQIPDYPIWDGGQGDVTKLISVPGFSAASAFRPVAVAGVTYQPAARQQVNVTGQGYAAATGPVVVTGYAPPSGQGWQAQVQQVHHGQVQVQQGPRGQVQVQQVHRGQAQVQQGPRGQVQVQQVHRGQAQQGGQVVGHHQYF